MLTVRSRNFIIWMSIIIITISTPEFALCSIETALAYIGCTERATHGRWKLLVLLQGSIVTTEEIKLLLTVTYNYNLKTTFKVTVPVRCVQQLLVSEFFWAYRIPDGSPCNNERAWLGLPVHFVCFLETHKISWYKVGKLARIACPVTYRLWNLKEARTYSVSTDDHINYVLRSFLFSTPTRSLSAKGYVLNEHHWVVASE